MPLSLGSDTNGSIRVPSSFCGLFGLKPTYGRLSRARTFPFVASLDHLGPLARCTQDLALAYDAMQGPDPEDPACADRPVEPVAAKIAEGTAGLRVAVAGGYFRRGASPEALAAVERVAKALGATREIEVPEAARARAAAFVISTTEGAALHLERLRARAADFEPVVRDRLISGAMVPAPLVVKAQKFRRWYRERVLELFETVDAILAPATPFPAPAHRPEDHDARRRGGAAAAQHRHLHPAHLVHRPAGRCGAGAARTAADRRADHRRTLARGRCAAHRVCLGGDQGRRRAAAGR